MKVQVARRIGRWLWMGSMVLGLASISLGINLVVGYVMPKEQVARPKWEKTVVEKAEPVELEAWSAIWEARILEEPVMSAPSHVKLQPTSVQPPKTVPLEVPWVWIGSVVDSQGEKSVAILEDKRKGKQIMVRQGDKLAGIYEVVKITEDSVEIACNGQVVAVRRAKPWQDLPQKERLTDSSLAQANAPFGKEKGAIASEFSDISPKDSDKAEGADVSPYRLQKDDRIVAVEGKRVRNEEEFREMLGETKDTARVSVLREGKVICLVIPTNIAGELGNWVR